MVISVNASHSANTLASILVSPVDSVTEESAVQPLNTVCPMVVTLSGMTMLVSLTQFWNTPVPIVTTLSGIVTDVKSAQSWNQLLFSTCIDDGRVMLVSPVFLNIFSAFLELPILVAWRGLNVSGNAIDLRPVQFRNSL